MNIKKTNTFVAFSPHHTTHTQIGSRGYKSSCQYDTIDKHDILLTRTQKRTRERKTTTRIKTHLYKHVCVCIKSKQFEKQKNDERQRCKREREPRPQPSSSRYGGSGATVCVFSPVSRRLRFFFNSSGCELKTL